MTALPLDEWQKACDEATKGPWLMRPRHHDDWGYLRSPDGDFVAVARPGKFLSVAELDVHRAAKTDPSQHNMEFISTARTAMPLLIAAVREKDAKIERLKIVAGLRITPITTQEQVFIEMREERDKLRKQNELMRADLAEQLPMRDADAFTIGMLNHQLAAANERIELMLAVVSEAADQLASLGSFEAEYKLRGLLATKEQS